MDVFFCFYDSVVSYRLSVLFSYFTYTPTLLLLNQKSMFIPGMEFRQSECLTLST